MIWFWIGFFALVAVLLWLDLAVFHKEQKQTSIRTAAYYTILWVCLGLAFTGVVYMMYEHAWLGAKLEEPAHSPGRLAAVMYVSAFLLEYALSIDNIFVISLTFISFRVPPQYQHRVLFWGILGAIGFRLSMLSGGATLAKHFDWLFYVFGAFLVFQGFKMFKTEEEDEDGPSDSRAIRWLRKFVRIVDGDHGGKFMVAVDGRRKAFTTLAICLVAVELQDIVFALDSIPAVLSVSRDVFIMVTSNVFAILGLRSLYSVLVGAMAEFKYLKLALGVLLVVIGAKMVAHHWFELPHWASLSMIAGIIGTGVLASIVSNKRAQRRAAAEPVGAPATEGVDPLVLPDGTDKARDGGKGGG